MMYPYMTLADETEIVHSQLIEGDGIQKVLVHFERPTEEGFDSARCELPEYRWLYREGYSDAEIEKFEQLLHSNAHLLYKYAANIKRETRAKWDESMADQEWWLYCRK